MALYNLAVSAHQRLGNRRGLAECYHNMAITYRDLGRLEEADELEQRSVADALRLAGVACTKQGKFTECRILLDEALERTRELGALLNAAETLRARAELLWASSEPDLWLSDARSALGLFHQLGAEREYAAIMRWIDGLGVDEGP